MIEAYGSSASRYNEPAFIDTSKQYKLIKKIYSNNSNFFQYTFLAEDKNFNM